MLLALLFLLYFFLYKNARLVRFSKDKSKVLARRHLRVENGEAVFRIDPSLQIYRKDANHRILLGGRLAGRQGCLTVLWGDRLILRVELRREIDITEELIRAFDAGVDVAVCESSGRGFLGLEGEQQWS
jgi:hypothetical protein